MLDCNARAVLEIKEISRKLLLFKSPLSREVLLVVASFRGECELRHLFKRIEATPTAIRLHVQALVDDRYVELCRHPTNGRCKMVRLAERGWDLMRAYELQVQQALSGWREA